MCIINKKNKTKKLSNERKTMLKGDMGFNFKIQKKMSPGLFILNYIEKALLTRLIISHMVLFVKTLLTSILLTFTADAILFRKKPE